MKLTEQFETFLEDVVNLNQTRIGRLEDHVKAIQEFLEPSSYEATIIRFSPQGSWAHQTIIKPQPDKEFDADLVMFVERHPDWQPQDYVNNLYTLFKSSGVYADKAARGNRCVVLDYAGDFHLDVVPCVTTDYYSQTFEVCNRNDNEFEDAAPEAYSAWFAQRNEWTGNNMLIHSVRLLKYLRDIKGRFGVKSILLTTLVGNMVKGLDSYNRAFYYPDLPTSLKTLVDRLDNFLQENEEMSLVENPVLSTETFNRHWDQAKYDNFRDCIHRYREWVDDAYDEEDENESIRKWRRVFGDDFAKGEVIASATFSRALLLQTFQSRDVVAAVIYHGSGILDGLISPRLPYVERLPWRVENQLNVALRVTEVSGRRRNDDLRLLRSGDVLEKDRWIRFEAFQENGLSLSVNSFDVHWQVVNTDQEAAIADTLRGEIYSSHDPGVRWESTEYHGAHWVEAFAVSKRTRTCWGRSGRFFVVIQ
ncbi:MULTISPECIES: cyclic GMP-AMP synthase DncV-like nucleotidyltransferase [Cyanophyceae]|uniref:SMODS domain-containing nucleotidyltransferase n=1 Tax=Cyanophyceae TaxID=3028117 RepID=UPI0016840E04|nr:MULTISPECIES: nucleotidyltransferase [Cyanophyceae]MBD1919439.1 nucleotidyltransferase [Phormidium sp. FACHB-77]MBD2054291.1 nucleotidyltransferase [Leptolyngbya sp. FACHB-60]